MCEKRIIIIKPKSNKLKNPFSLTFECIGDIYHIHLLLYVYTFFQKVNIHELLKIIRIGLESVAKCFKRDLKV